MNHPVGIPDRIVKYFPNRIVSWINPQHLVKFQDRMVNPVHYMKFLKRFVFVSNDYEIDVYVNHNRDITSKTAKVKLHNLLTVRHNKAIICNDNTRLAVS